MKIGINNKDNKYNAINLLDDLKEEVGRLVPEIEKPKGKLSNEKLSTYLGFEERYIRTLRTRISNASHQAFNPYFAFSKDQLEQMLINLEENFGLDNIQECIRAFEKYRAANIILEYRHQQWQDNNPELRSDFFRKLDDIEKGYYFGLMLADGTSDAGINIIIYLEERDRATIVRFRETLRITNKLEYKTGRVKSSGEYSAQYGIRVGCKPMMDDLRQLRFFDFKQGKALPEEFFLKLDRKIALSILCGFYDGDGEEGSTKIHNTNRAFLEQIKKEFNIRNEVRLARKGEEDVTYSIQGRNYVGSFKNKWYLSLGPEIFNEMMESFEDSMERKRKYYPLSINKNAYENLKNILKTKKIMEEVIRIAPITTLIEKFSISFKTFKKLCFDWNIAPLPHSYWKREENKNWRENFEDKFRVFKYRYLSEDF